MAGFRNDLFVQAFNDPETAPTSGTARLLLPVVLQLLWDAGVVVEFDPPDEVLSWVNLPGDEPQDERQAFLVRVSLAKLPASARGDLPGSALALAVAAILWTLLHRDVEDEDLHWVDPTTSEDDDPVPHRLAQRMAAQGRVRVEYAKMMVEVVLDDG